MPTDPPNTPEPDAGLWDYMLTTIGKSLRKAVIILAAVILALVFSEC